MILLSRLIKSGWSNPDKQEDKVISIKSFRTEKEEIEVSPSYSDILAEKETILNEAKKKADSIIAEANSYRESTEALLQQEKLNWEQEMLHLSNEARQTGFEAGFQEGKQLGLSEMHNLIEEARQTVDASKMDYIKKIENAEHTILDLGLKVAERILDEILEEKKEYVLGVVKRALKEARDYREIQLHVNPVHYDFLLAQKDDLLTIFPKETEFYIYPDPDLSAHSCIIESANGRIDASVDGQLEEIRLKLFELLESEMN
jgi:flagellar assembly protein FliH